MFKYLFATCNCCGGLYFLRNNTLLLTIQIMCRSCCNGFLFQLLCLCITIKIFTCRSRTCGNCRSCYICTSSIIDYTLFRIRWHTRTYAQGKQLYAHVAYHTVFTHQAEHVSANIGKFVGTVIIMVTNFRHLLINF